MKELSTLIKVHHIKMNKDFTFLADKFSFEPTSSDNDAGILFDCSLNKTIELPPSNVLSFFSSPQSCIISFTDSSLREIKVGSVYLPARVSINPYLNAAKININCKQTQSPFIL